MPDKKTPHVHAEFIKAWADGATIQFCDQHQKWYDSKFPMWCSDVKYRIKPEPKPDLVMVSAVAPLYPGLGQPQTSQWYILTAVKDYHNLKLTFDGETGKLKDAQVLATE